MSPDFVGWKTGLFLRIKAILDMCRHVNPNCCFLILDNQFLSPVIEFFALQRTSIVDQSRDQVALRHVFECGNQVIRRRCRGYNDHFGLNLMSV
jgi:hypothetical protein